MKNKSAGLDDNGIEELFRFQNISSEEYRELENIIENCKQNGLMIAVYEAFFWGTVSGKRSERRRVQNRLKQTRI